MTFDQIEYFMSCAACLNFSLAAKYHYVSVSTLSRNISALEEELGVKLFRRGYHGHVLTEEGIRFFDFAENATNELRSFWTDIGAAGKKGDVILIGCYPFDGMFGQIVEFFSKIPHEQFGKKYHVFFTAPGKMLETVRSGIAQLGIASEPELRKHREEFFSVPFYSSGFCVRPRDSGLDCEQGSITVSELLDMDLRYGDFLPKRFAGELFEKKLESEKDIAEIGRTTQQLLPELMENADEMKEKHFLLPDVIDLPNIKRQKLCISDLPAKMDFFLFCCRDVPGQIQSKLRELSDILTRFNGQKR